LRQSGRVLQSRNHLAWTTNRNGRRQQSGKWQKTPSATPRKQAVIEWFDEECEVVNEEKNALKVLDTQRRTRTAYNNYKQARTREEREEALIEVERHRSIQDTRKFYKRLNDVRRPFEAQVAMCRAKNGELLTKKD
jgi:hypothetical protein